MNLTRPDLAAVPLYKPARSSAEIARDHGITQFVRMASNEMPFGPLPGVVEAMSAAAATTHRYPDIAASELREKLSERYRVDASHVLTGCGSVALCESLATACAQPGDEIIYPWRSFEAYPLIVARTGAQPVPVPLSARGRLDVEALASAVTPRTRLVFVCMPNNPTSHTLSRDELSYLLDSIPPTTTVALDEAYAEFVTDPDAAHGPDYLERNNVVVLRTFSKAWGLAGARCGYLLSSPDIVEAVSKVIPTFSTSSFAQAGALAALEAEAEVWQRVNMIVAERKRVTDRLLPLIPDLEPGQANFLWLPLGKSSAPFGAGSEAHGIIVRPFPEGHHGGVRVTLGTPQENDVFCTVAETLLSL